MEPGTPPLIPLWVYKGHEHSTQLLSTISTVPSVELFPDLEMAFQLASPLAIQETFIRINNIQKVAVHTSALAEQRLCLAVVDLQYLQYLRKWLLCAYHT